MYQVFVIENVCRKIKHPINIKIASEETKQIK